jgi:hypothetical protein
MMTKRALVAVWLCLVVTACSPHSNPASSSPTSSSGPVATKLAVNQNSYRFPATLVGQVTSSPTFELSAMGSGSIVVASVMSSNPIEFALVDASSCVGMSLAGGSTPCRISVRFQPTTPGVRTAQITIASADGGTIVVDVYGSAFASGSSGSSNGGGGGSDSGGGSGGGGGGGGSSGGGSDSGGGSTGGGSNGGSTSGGGTSNGGGSFPQAPCVPNNSGGISLSVINLTSVLVQLTFTGPITQTMSLGPGMIGVAGIPPGNYSFDGQTPNNPSAIFIPSSWSVQNGCDYLLTLVVTSRGQMTVAR